MVVTVARLVNKSFKHSVVRLVESDNEVVGFQLTHLRLVKPVQFRNIPSVLTVSEVMKLDKSKEVKLEQV